MSRDPVVVAPAAVPAARVAPIAALLTGLCRVEVHA
jgi:hypothetical protein